MPWSIHLGASGERVRSLPVHRSPTMSENCFWIVPDHRCSRTRVVKKRDAQKTPLEYFTNSMSPAAITGTTGGATQGSVSLAAIAWGDFLKIAPRDGVTLRQWSPNAGP